MNEKKLQIWIQNRKEKKELYSVNGLFDLIKNGDRGALSRGITLLESTKLKDKKEANKLINLALPYSGNSLRIGITGVPGVGKSSFIESFGNQLVENGKKVAVLAIDPSSEKSLGSILGDKTRMTTLSSNENAFIRPTATNSTLGGVAKNTREAIILCELAGFDFIIIETVGVGQSETTVHSMVDFFLLLMLAGSGDELQGIKRGIMEMADLIVITKADGENVKAAKIAQQTFNNALHLFPKNDNNWIPKTLISSIYNPQNINEIIENLKLFSEKMNQNKFIEQNRKKQELFWFKETLNHFILNDFFSSKEIQEKINILKEKINSGKISSFKAAENLFRFYKKMK